MTGQRPDVPKFIFVRPIFLLTAVYLVSCGTTKPEPTVSKDPRLTDPVAEPAPAPAPDPAADPVAVPEPPPAPPAPPPPPPPTEVVHTSPDGIPEVCTLLQKFPYEPPDLADDPDSMRWYRKDDFKAIEKLCAMDFYLDQPTEELTAHGTCPKTHSTTPALEVFDLTETKLSKAKWQEAQCSRYKRRNLTKLAKLKIPVYSREAESGIMFFHFSRLLGNAGFVYPYTPREIARPEWVKLSKTAIAHIAKHKVEGTLGAWGLLKKRHSQKKKDPDVILGGLAKNPRGEHSHMTFRGKSFPIFKAILFRKTWYYKLANDLDPIDKSFEWDPTEADDYHDEVQDLAYVEDFTNLVIVDYIFNERDRNGNIEAKFYYHYVDEEGDLRWQDEDKWDDDDKAKHPNAVRVERLILKDNDDGLRWDKFGKLNMSPIIYEIRHMDPIMYSRMQWLAGLMSDEVTNAEVKKYFVEVARLRDFVYDELQYRFVNMANRFAKMYADGDLLLDLDLTAAVEAAPELPPKKKKKGKKKSKQRAEDGDPSREPVVGVAE